METEDFVEEVLEVAACFDFFKGDGRGGGGGRKVGEDVGAKFVEDFWVDGEAGKRPAEETGCGVCISFVSCFGLSCSIGLYCLLWVVLTSSSDQDGEQLVAKFFVVLRLFCESREQVVLLVLLLQCRRGSRGDRFLDKLLDILPHPAYGSAEVKTIVDPVPFVSPCQCGGSVKQTTE